MSGGRLQLSRGGLFLLLPPDARRLFVLYVRNATAEEMGLPSDGDWEAPRVGSSGTPKAHVMFAPTGR